jgi:hypothetical protein
MRYEEATQLLEQACASRDLKGLTKLLEEAEHGLVYGSHNSASFLLQACDVLSSYDFGDHEKQQALIHRYARKALDYQEMAHLESELKMLAHLQHDFDGEAEPGDPWPVRRLSNARRWLRALQRLEELTDPDFNFNDLPSLNRPRPLKEKLTSSASESSANAADNAAWRQNSHKAESFARQWRLRTLHRTYEPIAAKYIINAFGKEPYNLRELRNLLNDYLP